MSSSYAWIKSVESGLLELEERPQFGALYLFPWEALEKRLTHLLGEGVKITHSEKGWEAAVEQVQGMSEQCYSLELFLPPLCSPLFLLIAKEDLSLLVGALFGGEALAGFLAEKGMLQGTLNYLATEMLLTIEESGFLENLSGRVGSLQERAVHAEEEAFVTELELTYQGHTLHARLLLPRKLRSEWKAHFNNTFSLLASRCALQCPISLAVEIGETTLRLDEWKEVKVGDLIIVDKLHYDPHLATGRALVTLGSIPLFRGKVKEEGIKLLEYPLYQIDERNGSEENMDEEAFESKEQDEFEEEEEEEEVEESPAAEGKGISLEQIPVTLTLELGRVRMNLEELLKLSAGSLLDLKMDVESGVDLVVHGKKVGKGQLVKMGELLAVRIVQL